MEIEQAEESLRDLLTNLFNSLPTRQSREIITLKGDFIVDQPITLPSKIELKILGSLTAKEALQNPVFQGSNISDIVISGGYWDGNRSSNNEVDAADAIHLVDSSHIKVYNADFVNFHGSAVEIQCSETNCEYLEFKGLSARDCKHTVEIWGGPVSRFVRILNLFGYSNDATTVALNAIEHFSIIGCHGYYNGHEAIKIEGVASYGTVLGNVGKYNTYSGFYTGGCSYAVIANNVFCENYGSPDGGSGIEINGSYRTIVKANVCLKNGFGTGGGDYTGNNISIGGIGGGHNYYIKVVDNLCGTPDEASKHYGIRVYPVSHYTEVRRNYCKGQDGPLLDEGDSSYIIDATKQIVIIDGGGSHFGDANTSWVTSPGGRDTFVDLPMDVWKAFFRVRWNPQTSSGGIRLWDENLAQPISESEIVPGTSGWRTDEVEITSYVRNNWVRSGRIRVQPQTKGDGSTAPEIALADLVFHLTSNILL